MQTEHLSWGIGKKKYDIIEEAQRKVREKEGPIKRQKRTIGTIRKKRILRPWRSKAGSTVRLLGELPGKWGTGLEKGESTNLSAGLETLPQNLVEIQGRIFLLGPWG